MVASARWTAGALVAAVVLGCAGPEVARDRGPADDRGGTDVRTSTEAYGAHPEQVGDLAVPAGTPPAAGWPVVVLVHGGFWRQAFARDLMAPLADDLAERGAASWNVEYRRVGGDGGWPTTFSDVAAAVDHLATLVDDGATLDLDRVVLVGHSAGGHLALWAAGRGLLEDPAPGADPRVVPCLVVGQAAVADLAAGQTLGDGAAQDLLGGTSEEVPERYALADPTRLVGHGVPVLLTHGEDDDIVPLDQSRAYASAAEVAGDEVELVVLPGDHFAVTAPADALWQAVLDAVERTC